MTWAEEREELLRRVARDQELRIELTASGLPPRRHQELRAELERVDTANSAWLQTMLEQHGWPLRSDVGDEAAGAAWLLAQHADRDPQLQRHCLELMGSLPPDEFFAAQLAMLTDRVMLASDGVQRYGTQWELVGGDWSPQPLEDPDQVDGRRRDVGLGPLAEYRQVIAENHGKSTFLRPDESSEVAEP